MAAYSSSRVPKRTFLRMKGSTSSAVMAARERPTCLSSDSKEARPVAMFSSRRSFLNHWRILLRASLDLQIFIQSRLGPWADLEVITSTMSPLFSGVSKGTMRPLTLAPVMWLPTAEWML